MGNLCLTANNICNTPKIHYTVIYVHTLTGISDSLEWSSSSATLLMVLHDSCVSGSLDGEKRVRTAVTGLLRAIRTAAEGSLLSCDVDGEGSWVWRILERFDAGLLADCGVAGAGAGRFSKRSTGSVG